MITLFTKLLVSVSKFAPVISVALTIAVWLTCLTTLANSLWTEMFGHIDGVSKQAFGSIDLSPCALINYIFPLDFFCTLLGTYCALFLAAAAFRLVKAFIPTEN